MNFKNLGLSSSLENTLSEKGYTNPSPIQLKAIPPILEAITGFPSVNDSSTA